MLCSKLMIKIFNIKQSLLGDSLVTERNQLNLVVFVPVVVEPGSVARYDDVVGLLSHVVLMKV